MSSLRDAKPVTYRSFAGGINEYYSDYVMRDDEVRDCRNVEFRRPGRVDARQGTGFYSFPSYGDMPVRTMEYYTRLDGDHHVLLQSGADPNGDIYYDDDAGVFTATTWGAGGANTDGFTRMTQYRDVVFIGDEYRGLAIYSPDLGAGGLYPYMRWIGSRMLGSGYTAVPTWIRTVGGNTGRLPNKVFYYRFTFEHYAGNTFLGESHPLHASTLRVGGDGQIRGPIDIGKTSAYRDEGWEMREKTYVEFEADLTTGAANDRNVDFQILQSFWDGTWDDGTETKFVNIYRAGPFDAERSTTPFTYPEDNPKATESDGRFLLVGQIDCAAMYGQADTTVCFTDDGNTALGKQIEYRPSRPAPKPRFVEVHKDRLWLAAVNEITDLVGTDVKSQMNRIYLSEANQPTVFPAWSWVDIAPRDGEAITGIKSFRDKVMVAFKQTSMWAITGGDDVIFGNIPQISRDPISNNIGCIAPETITQAEGLLLWLSHRGPYMFDGSVPMPLKDRHVQETLRRIPDGRQYFATAAYHAKEREWWLAVTDSDEDADHNTVVLKYHFESQSWSRSIYPYGVGCMLEKENSALKPKLLIGQDDEPAGMTLRSMVVEADAGIIDTDAFGTTDIPWEFTTKKLDFGEPHVDKRLVAVLIEGVASAQVGLHIKCDERLDTYPTTGFFTPGALDGKELIHLDSRIWGRRFTLRVWGTVQAGNVTPYFEGVTCYYQTKEGVLEGA